VEDSGGWNVFKRGARNGRGQIDPSIKPLYPKPSYPYTTFAPYLSNHHIKVWALYIQNHGLSIGIVIYFG